MRETQETHVASVRTGVIGGKKEATANRRSACVFAMPLRVCTFSHPSANVNTLINVRSHKVGARAARATACDVHLGVRPEFLDIVSPESDGIPGEIVLVEPTGTDVMLTVDTPVGSLVVLNREGLSEGLEEGMKRERREYRPGEKLFLQPQQVRLFDPETGVRL